MNDLSQASTSPSSADLDLKALREISGGSQEILAEIIDEYVQMATELMASLVSAIDGRDTSQIARHAHTLKGSSGMVGAHGVMKASEALESAARASDMAGVTSAFADLTGRHASTLVELQAARAAG